MHRRSEEVASNSPQGSQGVSHSDVHRARGVRDSAGRAAARKIARWTFIVAPAKAGAHFSGITLVEAWTPAFAAAFAGVTISGLRRGDDGGARAFHCTS